MVGKTSLVVAIVSLVSMFAIAQQGPGGGPGKGPAGMHQAIVQKLNLTDQQQTQMRKLRVELEKKNIQTVSKIRLAQIDLKELMLADKPDRTTMEKRLKEITDLQHQMKLDRLDHMFAVNTLLTPEQQKIWRQEMNRPGRHRDRLRILREGSPMGTLEDEDVVRQQMRIFMDGGPMGVLEGEDEDVLMEKDVVAE